MSITISDDIIKASKMTEEQLKLEIAIMLFQQDKISIGKARQLAQMSLLEFQKELAKRKICIHYDVEELEQDIKTLQGMGRL
jgi:predicted HTH domain antitoxin